MVLLLLGSANRDPEQFGGPDRLVISRRDNRHVAFSHGNHHCLGAPLARLEAQVVFTTILRDFPRLRLKSQPLEWKRNLSIRGLKSLPVYIMERMKVETTLATRCIQFQTQCTAVDGIGALPTST
jgi:cytochrome P450